jgi:hypothetical protein
MESSDEEIKVLNQRNDSLETKVADAMDRNARLEIQVHASADGGLHCLRWQKERRRKSFRTLRTTRKLRIEKSWKKNYDNRKKPSSNTKNLQPRCRVSPPRGTSVPTVPGRRRRDNEPTAVQTQNEFSLHQAAYHWV